jgi:hypothetical protein
MNHFNVYGMKIDTIPHLFFQYEASIWSAGQEEDKMNR